MRFTDTLLATLAGFRWGLSIPVMAGCLVAGLVFATVAPTAQKLATPVAPKAWLAHSGVYERAPDTAIDLLLKQVSTTANGAGISNDLSSLTEGLVTEDDLRADAHSIFPPAWIQEQAERQLDLIYAYLRNEDGYTLSLDLGSRIAIAKNILAATFRSKVDALPLCTAPVDPSSFNLLRAECIPAGLSKTLAYQTIDEGIAQLPFLTKIGASLPAFSIPQAKETPLRRAFEASERLPSTLLALFALLLSILVLLIPNRAAKFYIPGAVLAVAGLAAVLASIVARTQFGTLVATFVAPNLPPEALPYLPIGKELASVIYSDVTGTILFTGLAMAAIGAGAFFIARLSPRPLYTNAGAAFVLIVSIISLVSIVLGLQTIGFFM